ncbi:MULTISPECIES: hypothetical protein [unclassified Streptomyces]|uniref:hypothetical protein n=1 Tax=unclassified Streptomyces TaxID=2593676 RepID=UPI0036F89401
MGSFFLGIRAMERLYAKRSMPGGFDPPDQPDNPFWSNGWISFLSDQDGWTGKFIAVRDGHVGSWFVGEITVTGEYESMAHYLDSVAETLTRIARGSSRSVDSPKVDLSGGETVPDWMTAVANQLVHGQHGQR